MTRTPFPGAPIPAPFVPWDYAPGEPKRPHAVAVLAALTGLSPEEVVSFLHDTVHFRPIRDPLAASPGRDAPRIPWDTPQEAWEALATRGLIPMEWVQDPAREWLCEELHFIDRGGPAPGNQLQTEWNAHPSSFADVYAAAADWQALNTAESLALEVASRLARWGVAWPSRVRWRLSGMGRGTGLRDLVPAVHTALDAAFFLSRVDPPLWSTPQFTAAYADDAEAAQRWHLAALDWEGRIMGIENDVVTGRTWAEVPTTVRGQLFTELPTPFEPLRALWASGYALHAFTPDAVEIALVPT